MLSLSPLIGFWSHPILRKRTNQLAVAQSIVTTPNQKRPIAGFILVTPLPSSEKQGTRNVDDL
jgi:hypothetical protein